MQLWIEIPSDTRWWHTPRGRNGKRYAMECFQKKIRFQTRAHRVALPEKQSTFEPFVWADVWIPEDRRAGIPILDPNWIEPGVYRTQVSIHSNKKTLAPFLASGLDEMDVRETA